MFGADGLVVLQIVGFVAWWLVGAVRLISKKETGEAMTVNKAILVGNLGQDPEIRSTGGGTTVANLRLATTHQRKDRDGNWNNQTEWHSVVVFGRTAENVGKYCKKGKQLFVEGRIETEKWQDREGKDRYTTKIIAENVRFLGGRGESTGDAYGGNQSGGYGGGNNQSNNQGNNQGNNQSNNSGGGNQADGGGMPYRDDEIPF
jgi:single-strand DNA-binding protein